MGTQTFFVGEPRTLYDFSNMYSLLFCSVALCLTSASPAEAPTEAPTLNFNFTAIFSWQFFVSGFCRECPTDFPLSDDASRRRLQLGDGADGQREQHVLMHETCPGNCSVSRECVGKLGEEKCSINITGLDFDALFGSLVYEQNGSTSAPIDVPIEGYAKQENDCEQTHLLLWWIAVVVEPAIFALVLAITLYGCAVSKKTMLRVQVPVSDGAETQTSRS